MSDLLKGNPMKFTGKIGLILLAVYLILTGLIAVFSLSFANLPILMGILALAAGVLILIDR